MRKNKPKEEMLVESSKEEDKYTVAFTAMTSTGTPSLTREGSYTSNVMVELMKADLGLKNKMSISPVICV